jgi:hypothetical protein
MSGLPPHNAQSSSHQPPEAFFQHPSSARFHRQTALTPQKKQFRQDAVSGQALTGHGHGHLPRAQDPSSGDENTDAHQLPLGGFKPG